MNDTQRSPGMTDFLENMAQSLYGRSRSLALAGDSCVKCGGPAVDFKDDKSRKEYQNTAFCQACQDEVFGE